MRVIRWLLATLLIAVGLLGAPWWADLAAERTPVADSEAAAIPTSVTTPQIHLEDSGEIWVDVNQTQQVVKVYRGSRVIRAMLASTGISSAPTPNGVFRVFNRGEWFYSEEFQQGAYFWVGLDEWGEYLFHSIPYTEDRQLIEAEASLLGKPASHGCVRLSLDDARWLYDYLPAQAKVVIRP